MYTTEKKKNQEDIYFFRLSFTTTLQFLKKGKKSRHLYERNSIIENNYAHFIEESDFTITKALDQYYMKI